MLTFFDRNVKIRLKKHQTDINKISIISCHRINTDHNFDWEGIKQRRTLLLKKINIRNYFYYTLTIL